jgi:hypothetical protein
VPDFQIKGTNYFTPKYFHPRRNMNFLLKSTLLFILLPVATGCDTLDNLTKGSSDGGSESITTPDAVATETAATTEPAAVPREVAPVEEVRASAVSLSAFSDFTCSGNWTNRDGALGLEAGSGNGSCETTFSGATASYRITITIQTEFDGKPYYSLSVNGREISSGQYPLSSSMACDCPKDNWWNVCPDKNVEIDTGVHTVVKGDIIKFYGEEEWQCDGHGAYAKWHSISLVPSD